MTSYMCTQEYSTSIVSSKWYNSDLIIWHRSGRRGTTRPPFRACLV